MKRSGPLKRNTPLRAKSKLKTRSKPVPKSVYQDVLARDMGCRAAEVIRIPCAGRIDPHHVKRRSQGGEDTPENLVSLCRAHHDWVHAHPDESYQLGFLKHGWE